MAAKEIGAVAADPFNPGLGKFKGHMFQLRKADFKSLAMGGLALGQLAVAEKLRTVKFGRVAHT